MYHIPYILRLVTMARNFEILGAIISGGPLVKKNDLENAWCIVYFYICHNASGSIGLERVDQFNG